MTARLPHADKARRERDELLLAWLHYRLSGWTCQSIADLYDTSRTRVANACARVREADQIASDEDVSEWYR